MATIMLQIAVSGLCGLVLGCVSVGRIGVIGAVGLIVSIIGLDAVLLLMMRL